MASVDIMKSSGNICKRFYVGNLFPNVSDIDLKKLFVKYGEVQNVEIKNKRDIDGNNVATFAFVTVNLKNADDNTASQCIRDCNNLKWKRNVIKVQLAQESFLQRLEKERQNVGNAQSSSQSYDPLDILRQRGNVKNNDVKDNLLRVDQIGV